MTFVICLSLVSLLCGSFDTAAAQGTPLVNKIEIRGLKRIEEGALRTKISQKPGEAVSQEKTNEDIRAIFKMGYFEDVRIELEAFEGGVRLIYIVKEKPTIIRIDYQGNKELDDTKLKEKISITPGSIADTVLIQDNASKLRSFYEEEGYWLANVVPVTKKISGDDISLTYQIDEGAKVKLRKISFEGNQKISASGIKKVMETKEWWMFSFLSSSSGYYKKDRMESDIEKIRNLYYNEGYLKAIVGEPQVSLDQDRKNMTVTISISEGEVFSISSVEVAGNKTFDSETLKKLITITPNTVFRKNLLEKNIQAISGLYTEGGFAMVSIIPDLTPDEKNRTVRVILTINEGEKYRIGRIEVSGNLKTRDKVIRRELRFDEGEIFNSTKLRRSYERINNLNFFETAEIVPKPRAEQQVVDLEVRVKERPTGMLSVGGGYSSVDKLIGTVDLTQGNLFGKGQFAKIKAELGGKSSFYEISFRDPWFQDKPISLSTGIYRTTREYTEYSKKAFGFFVGFGKDFSEYWKGDISYNFERATIYDIKAGASAIVFDQKGTSTTSAITPSVIRDSRDNYLDPSRGSRNALSVTFAGLGGSNKFIKASADSAWYFPVRESAVMVRGRVGYAKGLFNETLPLYERFYVGGISTLRGIGFGIAGPKDPATGEAIGGTTQLIFNAEYIFPLITDMKLKGVVFFDAGNSYEEFNEFGKLRYTSGAGVRWISPIGPIRIEWGYNIKKKPGESSSKVEFAFGSFF
ncbi:MAG: outer membrane protein assembly factor BamA [Thermodesulfovibrio sp.]|nr:outer membrane protein assembly factor BamA [Thermodesulfovibrio sp.]